MTLAGPARMKAGSGDIDIEEIGEGDIDIRTGSGNITVKGINGGFHAEAGSGDIRGDGMPKNLWSIRTGSGNVSLRVPSDAAFDVDVSSSSGTVTMGHPVTATIQGRVQESRKSVVGKVRGGGPTISVHTGRGTSSWTSFDRLRAIHLIAFKRAPRSDVQIGAPLFARGIDSPLTIEVGAEILGGRRWPRGRNALRYLDARSRHA